MKPFQAPVEDILFSMTQIADASSAPDWDEEMARAVLEHFASFAEGEIAPLDETGDAQGCRLEDGQVRMPDGFSALYRAYCDQGWPGLTAPEAYGGQEQSALMLALTSEVFSGANHSLQMVTGLVPGAIRTLLKFGTEDQKARHMPGLASGDTLATMCLTEAGAGSDLSRIRCRARQEGDDWKLTGEKIFISGGDQDMSDAILHLVLARTSDDGIRGLSLFLCPSRTGDGSPNPITVTRIEEKMGLHASPTCQLAFDGVRAELIGVEGQGLRAMFTMMNHARVDVALQGVAHAARARDVAETYANERHQGRNAEGRNVVLSAHSDVRRMLDEIDACALGGRAIAHLAFVTLERGDNPDLVDFLTPIAKVHCTSAGIRAAELGIQVLGGYGYLREYRLEQTYRDARITAIYEGANGIHERMLATRLLGGSEAAAFQSYIADQAHRDPSVDELVNLWREVNALLCTLDDPSPFAHDYTALTARVLLCCLWSRMLLVADQHPDPDRIRRVARQARGRDAVLARAHAALVQTEAGV